MSTPLLFEHADGVARPYHAAAVHRGVAYPCGQVPVLPDGSVPAGLADQVRVVLDNLDAVLTRVGSGLGSLLQITVYLRDLETFDTYNQAYLDRMAGLPLPPRTTVQVAGFRGPKCIEIAAIAAVDQAVG